MTTTPPPSDPRGQQPGHPPPPAYSDATPTQVPLRGPRPKEVEISFWLWIATVVLGVVGALITYPQLDRIRADAIDQALAQDPTLDRSLIESVTTGALVGGIVIGLLFVIAELVFVFLMRGGRNWARIVLAVLGGLGVLFGMIGLTGATGSMLAVSVPQLLLLIGAIVAMFLPAANAWFQRRPGF